MPLLRGLAFEGVPDEPRARGLRASVWRVLLGLLPAERAQWERVLRRKRAEYAQFCEELILDPKNLSTPADLEAAPGSHPNPLLSHGSGNSSSSLGSGGAACEEDAQARLARGGGAEPGGQPPHGAAGSSEAPAGLRAGVSALPPSASAPAQLEAMQRLAMSGDDHPLSNTSGSRWKAYFQDVEVQEQIERDVARTHPDMHFFSGEGGAAATRRAQMRRALFVFAKLNPGLRYVQGMNELYAPLYFLFRTDPDAEAAQHAEADAFFCFVDLMGEFRDHFCQQLDNTEVGIRATLGRLNAMLRAHDEELWEHLDRGIKINPQFYAFRWITLALTQEFSFPDALRLWDSLLSDPAGRTDCLLRLCIAMLLNVRQELLQGDFATCMKLLQRYPSVDVHLVLARAEALKRAKTVIVLD
ncbi:TBC1 domain family member 13 [Micractinium conductrix]|uniref:TBC1 domain family member 13 n=1 Tax=Micractinium conductrix TaxID=554055 RepID=A0A2P6V0Q4_9CHLO|nr:TBC1 domain family member 13 [Micractinium conductrix]|eukprot:PSC67678.1 TBC1 domain family member 13 [Micractinium conductrix]